MDRFGGMRRLVAVAGSTAAVLVALAVGPLGTAAAAPYVYGCTPANYYNNNSFYPVILTVYNPSAASGHLTHKILAGDGTVLNGSVTPNPLPLTSTLPPTHTSTRGWLTVGQSGGETNSTVGASVRVVSDVPVSVTLSHNMTAFDNRPEACLPIVP